MTSSDDDFARQLLKTAASSAPTITVDVTDQLSRGRRRVRLRRWRNAVAAVAVLAVVAGGAVGVIDHVGVWRGSIAPGAGSSQQWPVATDDSAPVDSAAVLDAYQVIDTELLEQHPDEWGGAFYDGDTLVVNSVTRTGPDAVALLRTMGVPAGVVVRQTRTSIATFDRATAAITNDGTLMPLLVSVGPDYSEAQLVVGVRGGADRGLVRDRLSAVLDGLGAGLVPYTLVDGGTPMGAAGG